MPLIDTTAVFTTTAWPVLPVTTTNITNAAREHIGQPWTLTQVFGLLRYVLNGNLDAENFSNLVSLFDSNSPYWSRNAIQESKVRFDVSDGHDHVTRGGKTWPVGNVIKKNLDPASARVVWTALEGFPASTPKHGVTVLAGVHKIGLTVSALASGTEPGGLAGTAWTVASNFVPWVGARYWLNATTRLTGYPTTYTGSSLSPFCPGVVPVVAANFFVPFLSAGEKPALFWTVGRTAIEVQSLDAYQYQYGFWVWWTGFGPDTGVSTDSTLYICVPWMAFGPGGYGWV